MNLYKVKFSHHSPKDSEEGIKALILAENEEQVYDWIASEPTTNEGSMYNSWNTMDSDDEGWFDDDDNPELFKDRMLRLKGNIEDDSVDFSDAYYGITLFGWELLKKDVLTDYSELIDLGIVFYAKPLMLINILSNE